MRFWSGVAEDLRFDFSDAFTFVLEDSLHVATRTKERPITAVAAFDLLENRRG